MNNILMLRVPSAVLKQKKGLTLVELIVAMALTTLILGLIFTFFGASNRFFLLNNNRADAQAQVRLILLVLQKEVNTADYVSVHSFTDPSAQSPSGSQRYFYVKMNSDSKYVLMRKDSSGENAVTGSVPVDTLSITFSVLKPNMLGVLVTSNESYSLNSEIHSPNVQVISDGASPYNTLVCEPAH